MNGEWLGSRAIRVNWANQKTQTGASTGGGGRPGGGPPMPSFGSNMPPYGGPPPQPSIGNHTPMSMGTSPAPPAPSYAPAPTLSYETVSAQTPEFNTTVYVGNLIPYTTQADLIPLFQGYGYIVEIRMQADRGFAFVKLDTHQNAALAITHLQNQLVQGRPIKCSWGKDKDTQGGTQPGVAAQQYPMVSNRVHDHSSLTRQASAQPQMGYAGYPGYYGGYGYGQTGVPGQPGAAAGAATDSTQQAGGWDPTAAAAYYQTQGWGGYYCNASFLSALN